MQQVHLCKLLASVCTYSFINQILFLLHTAFGLWEYANFSKDPAQFYK